MKTKTNLITIVFASIFSTGLFTSCLKESIANKMLDKLAVESNKLCPMNVDYMTRCDSITHPEPLTLAYYYTLSATTVELDSMQMDWSLVKDQIISSIKTNRQVAPLLVFNIKFRHTYFDSEEQEIYKAEISPEDYKRKKYSRSP